MPSPVVASDPVAPTNQRTHSNTNGASVANNTNGYGSVPYTTGANGTSGGVTAPASDAIREGKERAKAVMAAQGVSMGANTPTKASMSESNAPTVNGVAHGRKRSRSGSPKPLEPERKEISVVDDEHAQYLLERYRARDDYAIVYKGVEGNAFTQELKNLTEVRRPEMERITRANMPRMTPQDIIERMWIAPEIYGGGFKGYGNGWTMNPEPALMYPNNPHRKWAGHRGRRDPRIRLSRKQLSDQAEEIEDLVPIRLDIEHDKIKLRDTFTWNVHDRLIDANAFAATLVEDFKVPQEHFPFIQQQVAGAIAEAVQEYHPHTFIEDSPEDPAAPYPADKNDEMRIVVKLNITIGAHTLVDQFEWDINNSKNSPEEFARQLAKDMALSGEFTTAIAHQIREQVQMFTKSLYITGHPFDGRPIEDSDVRDNFLPSPIPNVFRPIQSQKDYIPFLYELSNEELSHQELSILRDQRRQKRSTTRRGGPALPDLKDRERTVRSLVVSNVLPGAADTIENARLFKYSRASGRGRRANRLDGSDSEDEEESESESEEVTQITGGTARTRGMRGAASAAQAAMRATLGRSQTPELAQLETPPHHERRATSRALRYEMREESVPEPTSLIVKLRINPTRYRAWLRNYQARPPHISTPQMNSRTGTPQHIGQAPTSMPPPPSPAPGKNTPRPSSRGASVNESKWRYHPDGSVDAPDPLPEDESQVPPPPSWLTEALEGLRTERPRDSFEGFMKLLPADRRTGHQIKMEEMEGIPKEFQMQKWFPRIRCNDCPGKSYNAKPAEVVQNFVIHLNNRKHRDQVDARVNNRSRPSGE